LRRQHLLEGLMFLDKLQRAFRARAGQRRTVPVDGGQAAPDGKENIVNAKEILEALATTDHWLTEDQRNLYLLRGFGRRLPDMPSSTAEEQDKAAEAVATASRVAKVRRMLQDYCTELVEAGSTVSIEDLVKRILSSGVAKGGRHWQPEFTPEEIAQESGLRMWQVATSSNPKSRKNGLVDLVKAHMELGGSEDTMVAASHGREGAKSLHVSIVRSSSKPSSPREASKPVSSLLSAGGAKRLVRLGTKLLQEKEKSDPWDRYCFLAEVARNIQELSLGYPGLYLSYWVNHEI